VRLTNKIKDFIKANKQTLLREKGETEKKIFEIKVANDARLKDTLLRKSESYSKLHQHGGGKKGTSQMMAI
jgi:hypothetical protein